MSRIERIQYDGRLPESFFAIPQCPYAGLSFAPDESKPFVEKLWEKEAEKSGPVIYTDHKGIRLAAMFPAETNDCYFGFWETIHDCQLNASAFGLLQADALARGKTAVIGPINFNTFHQYRLRTGETPSWTRFDREPVNPPYYPALLQRLGFTIIAAYESRLIPQTAIPAVYSQKQLLLDELGKLPYDLIPLNPVTWAEHETGLYGLIDAIFSQNPFYQAISREEFGMLYNRGFAEKLCPYSSVLFRDRQNGRLAAISLCHPNYLSRSTKGIPPNFERDYSMLEKKVLLAKSVGVHPGYRRQGLMNFLGAYGMLSFREHYEEVIFCTMRSDNFSLHFTDGLKYEKAGYALYKKALS